MNKQIDELSGSNKSLLKYKNDYMLLHKEMKKIKSYSKDIITIVDSVFRFLKLFNNEINSSMQSILNNMKHSK